MVASSDEETEGDGAERSPFDERDPASDDLRDETDPIDDLVRLCPADRMGPERTWLSGSAGERAQLERLARGCLEEIAAISTLRKLEPEERYSWSSVSAFEQRMLSCLDALLAFGRPYFGVEGRGVICPGLDPAATALAYGEDGAAADPARIFASTFVLGCLEGDDAARAAVASLQQLGDDCLAAAAEALWLASSPQIDDLLAELVDTSVPPLSQVAVDLLTRRGGYSLGGLQRLLESHDPGLRAAACRGLAFAVEHLRATELLCEVVGVDRDPDVRTAAMEALALHQAEVPAARRGIEQARDELQGEIARHGRMQPEQRRRVTWLLALAGQASDHSILAALFDHHAADASLLGFHGHPALVGPLLARLDSEEEPTRRLGAAVALARIVGMPGSSLDPSRTEVEPDALRARCAELGSALQVEQRLRFGVPWSPTHSAAELAADGAPLVVREACARELGICLAERPVSVRDLAARQLAAIGRQRAALAIALARGEHQPGRWPGDP